MLDAGFRLEPDRRELVQTLSQLPADQWSSESIDRLKGKLSTDDKGVPHKRLFGSDFPYRHVEELIPTSQHEVDLRGTLAYGGFSNLWGSAVLPYAADDIQAWPISVDDLAPHYEAVFSWMDLAAVEDDLATTFPLYARLFLCTRDGISI
jgi:hypothetical protein